MPVAGSGASVKAASNASADQDLAPWENLQQVRNSDDFLGQQPSSSDNNVPIHFPQSATHLSNVSKRGEANRPTVIQNVSPLEPISNSTNQAIGESTKSMREKFKTLEKTGGAALDKEDTEKKEVNTIDPATSEATRSAKARWKDIESGKTEQVLEKPKINLNGPGGVYENEPDSLVNIARGWEKGEAANIVVTTSAAERREAFLKKATAEGSVKRLDPAAELQELAKREKNAVYENTPAPRPDDVVAAERQEEDLSKLRTAKTIREKFADPSQFQTEIKKTVIDMRGEGGVYENEPERRADVVHYDESDDQPEPGSVKWASSAKERFMKDAEERSKAVRRTESITVEEGGDQGTGVGGKFATTAKQQFLERQREAEEANKKKQRPGIIDIWSELPKESGVFENTPAARAEGVVVSGMYSDDEEEEEDGEEG
nr:unnamed protein product [Spirometra erinaceieuropaei]